MVFLSDFYRSVFFCKVYKISLDAGCTCPNRDGSKGVGGCIFCSETGSGDFASSRNLSIKEQVDEGKKRVESKLKGRSGNRQGKYIAYFQNFTSTYGNSEELGKKYLQALECPDVVGLAIATRPDCLSDEILLILKKISQNHFVQIELGLQTSNEVTGKLINRCYSNDDYLDAVKRIKKADPNIHIVTHLIFGLPGESEKDMLKSVSFVVNSSQNLGGQGDISVPSVRNLNSFFGIKITVLYIVKNTLLAKMYQEGKMTPLSKEKYYSLLGKALTLLPDNCVVHRLTGDPPKNILIAPQWPCNKKKVMNEIGKLIRN
ncbi:MAG: TIGR01212 family radical SAM protein [Treponema sp.]|nr:TIGR01212 family radical SAM protein [Treponema sp.]